MDVTVFILNLSYYYSEDRVWAELNRTVLAAIASRKQQEEFLKHIPYEGRIVMDESTGEEYRAYPPAKSGGDGVVLNIR
jgi:hypothetical protein